MDVFGGFGRGASPSFLAYRSLDKIQIIRYWTLSSVLLMGNTFRGIKNR